MVSASRSFRVAALSGLIGAVGVATVLYHISVFESPDDGGTSLAGLAFFFLLLVCAATVAEAGFVAILVRWGDLSAWPRRILVVGAGGGGLAALSVTLLEIPEITSDASVIGRALEPLSSQLVSAVWAFAFVGLAGTLAGFGALVVNEVREN